MVGQVTREANQSSDSQPSFSAEVAGKAHASIDKLAVAGESAETKARNLANEAAAKVQQVATTAEEKARNVGPQFESSVKQNPFAAVAGAFAIGFILSAILRR